MQSSFILPLTSDEPASNGADKLLVDIVELARLTSLGVRTLRRIWMPHATYQAA